MSNPSSRIRRFDLARVDLSGAPMGGLVAEGAYVPYANFSFSLLDRSSWTCTDASDAIFGGTHLTGAFMDGTNLAGADLSNADLSSATLKNVYWNDKTKWPSSPASLPKGGIPTKDTLPPGGADKFLSDCLDAHSFPH